MKPTMKEIEGLEMLFKTFLANYTSAETKKERQRFETTFVVSFLRYNANDWGEY